MEKPLRCNETLEGTSRCMNSATQIIRVACATLVRLAIRPYNHPRGGVRARADRVMENVGVVDYSAPPDAAETV